MSLPMLRICRNALLAAAVLLTACASLPDYHHPAYDEHLPAPVVQNGGSWASLLQNQDPQASGLALLATGTDAFAARMLLAATAQQSLDLQYYLFHKDLTGQLLVWMLLQAADRGVQVRVLLDDMASRGADDYLRIINRHPHIQIRLFNPFQREYPREMQFLTRYGISTRRMHNKSMTADNTVTIVGGRNIGDEYFDAARNAVVFGDLDVLTLGPVVEDVSTEFDHYWNSELALPVEYVLKDKPAKDPQALAELRRDLQLWAENRRDHPYAGILRERIPQLLSNYEQRLQWGRAYVVSDHPEKISASGPYVSPVLLNTLRLMENAGKEVLLVSPYFVPGPDGVKYLKSLVKRGIRVTVLTNSLASTDVPAVHSAYKHYREELLRAGVELWELRPDSGAERRGSSWLGSSSSSLHAKFVMIDSRYFYVGSMNFDPRSARQNTEMGMLFEQPEVGAEAERVLTGHLAHEAYRLSLQGTALRWHGENDDGRTVTYNHDPEAGIWRRLQSWVLGVLPLESEL